MKKLAGAMGFIIMFGTGNFAYAATKCVALNSSSTCTGIQISDKVDWTVTCNSIPITGVGVCSSTFASRGETADTIATENTTDANDQCWCKMTSPAVSRFVYSGIYGSAAACSSDCARQCVFRAINNEWFRAGMFSNLQ